MFFKKRASVNKIYKNSTAKPDFLQARSIGEELIGSFLSSEYDEVYLAYNRFRNPILQIPVFEKILPIESKNILDGKKKLEPVDYIFEPEESRLLEFLIPEFLFFKIYYALLENSAGEHGARMTAMEKASTNASELMDKYVLLRNRARQAAITTELIEIVSGADALN